MPKYRHHPVEVEAVQWTGQPVSELPDWIKCPMPLAFGWLQSDNGFQVPMRGWCIRGDHYNEHMEDAEFRATYEPMEEPNLLPSALWREGRAGINKPLEE